MSPESTVHALHSLKSLKWLDISDCRKFKPYHIEEIVCVSRNLRKLNICGTVGYTLNAIKSIEKRSHDLDLLKFCAVIHFCRIEEWLCLVEDSYKGALRICDPMSEIIKEILFD